MKLITLTFAFLLSSISIFAQTTARGASAPAEDFSIIKLDNTDWSFYADEDNRTFYIDFEKININLSDVVVKNSNGEIVFKDEVIDLPVNAIYEFDFADYRDGEYIVELRSFTKIIQKEISIK